jgi:hypothetical protein
MAAFWAQFDNAARDGRRAERELAKGGRDGMATFWAHFECCGVVIAGAKRAAALRTSLRRGFSDTVEAVGDRCRRARLATGSCDACCRSWIGSIDSAFRRLALRGEALRTSLSFASSTVILSVVVCWCVVRPFSVPICSLGRSWRGRSSSPRCLGYRRVTIRVVSFSLLVFIKSYLTVFGASPLQRCGAR